MQDALSPSLQSEFRFDSRRIIDILRRRRLLVLICAVIAPVAAFAFLSRQAPVYQASATIVIDATTPQYLGNTFRDVVDLDNNWWSAQEYLNTQYHVLQSRNSAEAAAQAFCTRKMADGSTVMQAITHEAGCTPTAIDHGAVWVMSHLTVNPIKETRLVDLSVRDANPEVTQIAANTIAETYQRLNLERRLKNTENAADWLHDEYGDLSTQLRAAEDALVDFKKKNNLLSVAIDDQQNELAQKRKKVGEELTTVQLHLIALSAQREQYKGLSQSDPLTDTSPQLQENPVIQKMKETYATEYQKLVELRGKYLDKHPAVIAQEARLAAVKQDIDSEARLSMKALDGAFLATQRQEKELASQMDQSTREGLALEARTTDYNRLKRNFERLQKLSETVGGREKESTLATQLKTNNVYVLDKALLPAAAIQPNPLIIGAVALVLGFLIGFGFAFVLDLLDSSIKSPEDIESRLRVPFLGIIPRISQADREMMAGVERPVELFIQTKPKSQVAECCQSIRTSLLFMSPDKPLKRLLVASGNPKEGKSTTAVNLALTMAQSGQRVLLVDTDMRKPRLHKVFKAPMTAGFSSCVAGESKPEDAIHPTDVPNLWFIPCGPIPPNPAELLHSESCRALVNELGQRFDRVVFDSPPLGVVTDAAILSQLCDGVVLVAKSGKTSRELLSRILKTLTDLKANILGCILNDLDLASRSGYGYRYYTYRYGTYYGEEPAPATPGAGG